MARNSRTPAQRRALIAEAEDKARQVTEDVLNKTLNQLSETLDLWNYASLYSEPMAKVVEKTARKVLNRYFKGETRGRKPTVGLGYFDEQHILKRGAELAREGIGVSKAAEIIHEELRRQLAKRDTILKGRGFPPSQVPTVAAIKGRLERSRR
jgi:hypothetical protein